MSARQDLLTELVDSFTALDNGKYTVRRGVVDWSSWDFRGNPRAISIQIDSETLLPDRHTGFYFFTIGIEVMARVSQGDLAAGISDSVGEELITDCQKVVLELMRKKNAVGDNVITFLNQDVTLQEVHDLDFQVQGIILNLEVRC